MNFRCGYRHSGGRYDSLLRVCTARRGDGRGERWNNCIRVLFNLVVVGDVLRLKLGLLLERVRLVEGGCNCGEELYCSRGVVFCQKGMELGLVKSRAVEICACLLQQQGAELCTWVLGGFCGAVLAF